MLSNDQSMKSELLIATFFFLTLLGMGQPTDAVLEANAGLLTKEHFLPDWNSELRARQFDKFHQAKALAFLFVNSQDEYVAIGNVVSDSSNWWELNGHEAVIHYNKDNVGDEGVLYHEIFHSVFHKSNLHNGTDELWGEGFCDAFRYFMEKQIESKTRSGWLLEKERRLEMIRADQMQAHPRTDFERVYSTPSLLIISKSDYDFDSFLTLWKSLNELRENMDHDILNTYFQYDIETGIEIQ